MTFILINKLSKLKQKRFFCVFKESLSEELEALNTYGCEINTVNSEQAALLGKPGNILKHSLGSRNHSSLNHLHTLAELQTRAYNRSLSSELSWNTYHNLINLCYLKVSTVNERKFSQLEQALCNCVQITQLYSVVDASHLESFDEDSYLAVNTDVKDGVENSEFTSGYEHFLLFGAEEINCGSRYLSIPDRDRANQLSEKTHLLNSAGIIDKKWYTERYNVSTDPVEHYVLSGRFNGAQPNYYFEPTWYCHKYRLSEVNVEDALFHYIQIGERKGLVPSYRFDPLWYFNEYKIDILSSNALGHYISIGRELGNSPSKYVSVSDYTEDNPDVARAGQDVVEHFFERGWKEGRSPSRRFDSSFYRANHLYGFSELNPLQHYIEVGESRGLAVNSSEASILLNADDTTRFADSKIPAAVKKYANPGENFEEEAHFSLQSNPRIRNIAFYLPQFHAFDENNRWWGEGFTEWRNIMRGLPRYEGHYQPRIPRDLGFYDLNSEDVIFRQSELAKRSGISGFCFYYYWFDGTRLMDMPLDKFVSSPRITSDFCIMWANENWTRTWDGMENNVLMQQNYRIEDESAFIENTARYMLHERYIWVDGRPLFILYRPGLVPDAKQTIERWREKWKSMGVEPLVFMVQGFGCNNPIDYGLDGAIEFPPHKLCEDLKNINQSLNIYDSNFSGHVLSYDDVIAKSAEESVPDFPLIKTVCPHWDNDARREGRGFSLHGSTPQKYEKWLRNAIDYSLQNPIYGESSFVFVNAWNEWAEGTYLEPDVHYGHAYLNANRRAVFNELDTSHKTDLVLVGHDAHKHGAQMLLLNMAKIFNTQFGIQLTILLLEGGKLVDEYRRYGTVKIIKNISSIHKLDQIKNSKSRIAISNTCVTGDLVPELKAADFTVVSLIHELPRLISQYGLEQCADKIAANADSVLFPATMVQAGFMSVTGSVSGDSIICPQGTYQNIELDDQARARVMDSLNIPSNSKIVLNSGYADLRKGFDIFLNVARESQRNNDNVYYLWLGGISPEMDRWILEDYGDLNNVICLGHREFVSDYYNACDVFLLTSREDPYPTVVLEAMSVGKPVICIKNTTGFDELVDDYGVVSENSDPHDLLNIVHHLIDNDNDSESKRRQEYVAEYCRFDDYCFTLLELLIPEIKKVSVIVPNYNYDEHISSRLESVFGQTYPLYEILVLDDCSSDNSIEVIEATSTHYNRKINRVYNSKNSGNTFKQWKKGTELARGDVVWIAEADDLADESFLSVSVSGISKNTALTFTDSKQIDENDNPLATSYSYYYDNINKTIFSSSFSMPGTEFCKQAMAVKNPILNVSSVLWDKNILTKYLNDSYDEIISYKVAGDWRLYIEILCLSERNVTYINESLNVHRRHSTSVTHSLDPAKHLDEIESIHRYIIGITDIDDTTQTDMKNYTNELKHQFGLKHAA